MVFRWTPTFNRPFLIAAVLYAAFLFYLSSQSTLPMPQIVSFEDLVAHAAAYAILYSLLFHAFPETHPMMLLIVTALYGLSDEWHQSFVPGRVPDVWDFAADAAGGTIAMIFWTTWIRRRGKKSGRM